MTHADIQRTWIGQGGEVFCTEHAGHYLTTAVAADPAGLEHHTPMNHWIDSRHSQCRTPYRKDTP